MITIISGTNRKGSVSSQLSAFLADVYRELQGESDIIDLVDLPLETLSPEAYVQKPPQVEKFIEQILASSGLVVVVPEYNGSMPGALKLFIDMLPFPESFEGRPVCYVGIAAGQFAGLRPVEHLQQVFGYRNAFNFPRRVFIPFVGNIVKTEGGFNESDYASRLREQAEAFLDFCRSLGRLK